MAPNMKPITIPTNNGSIIYFNLFEISTNALTINHKGNAIIIV